MGEGVSARAFAKLESCAHTLVNRHIKSGNLKAFSDGTIDPELVGSGWCHRNRMNAGQAGPAPRRNRKAEQQIEDDDDISNFVQVADALKNAPGGTTEEKAAHVASQGNLFHTLSQAELRKQTFLALMAEHKYNVEIGTVVPVDAVARIVGEKFAAVRNRILAIPGEEAPRVHRCKTVAEVQAALLNVVTEALEEISSGDVMGHLPAGA